MNRKVKVVRYQDEIATIKQIRTRVFQLEQGISSELEFDGLDQAATHLLAYLDRQPVGTARIRDIDANTFKIERLAVLPEARKQGIGRQLMQKGLETIAQSRKSLVVVHAQEYVAPLYQQLGFAIVGEKFSEAGIAHVKMVKQLSEND